jgi:hypothetical protein
VGCLLRRQFSPLHGSCFVMSGAQFRHESGAPPPRARGMALGAAHTLCTPSADAMDLTSLVRFSASGVKPRSARSKSAGSDPSAHRSTRRSCSDGVSSCP